MDQNLVLFFEKTPQLLPVYEAFEKKVNAALGAVNIRVQKTQITFSNKHNFAMVSLAKGKIKGRPGQHAIVTFGLQYPVQSERIYVKTEPYPNRWTHHVLVQAPKEVDEELMGWVEEAYYFSLSK